MMALKISELLFYKFYRIKNDNFKAKKYINKTSLIKIFFTLSILKVNIMNKKEVSYCLCFISFVFIHFL